MVAASPDTLSGALSDAARLLVAASASARVSLPTTDTMRAAVDGADESVDGESNDAADADWGSSIAAGTADASSMLLKQIKLSARKNLPSISDTWRPQQVGRRLQACCSPARSCCGARAHVTARSTAQS